MNKEDIEKVAEKHFIELMKYHLAGKENLAILSIDMQSSFLDTVLHRKIPFLEAYHNKIKELAIKNNILFIYSGYEKSGNCLNQNKNDLFFPKESFSALSNPSLVEFIITNKIKTIYCIGLYRNNCVWSTICSFLLTPTKPKEFRNLDFRVITSYSGTGHTLDGYKLYSQDINKKYNILSLREYGLIFLDYYSKD